MAYNVDWLPGKRTEQLAMAMTWRTVLGEKGGQWDILPGDFAELDDWIGDAEKWLAKAMSSDRNPVITARCKEVFDGLTNCMRHLKSRKFFCPPMTDADLVELGLRPRDNIKTVIADPTGQAEADITYPGPHLLMLHMKPLAGTAVDPRADHGCRIYYGVLPHGGATLEEAAGASHYLRAAPIKGDDLPHSQFTRRKKELMVFSAADSGKTAYFCIRYENAKGKYGPWGPVFSAVIP